ncbi:MAG: hypothetical protein HXY30_11815 [Pseudorhodoplanes sp.]|nr:hypothetical protein [Pseudorhodoplanes sp.]
MADKRSLRLIGYFYGGLTAAVTLVACFVVAGHVTGQMTLDNARVASVQASAFAR